jgi:topoisomerase-4 subunit A
VSTTAYKFKTDEDILVGVSAFSKDKGNAIIITKKAMAIRFDIATLNSMGRVASGVTAISLKEDDEVVFGNIFSSSNDSKELTLTTVKKEKKQVKVSDIKIQNRATRGSNVMPVAFDDFISNVRD